MQKAIFVPFKAVQLVGLSLFIAVASCGADPPVVAPPRGALLVVDADHNGVADPAAAADVAGRATLDRGAIFLANIDDDDRDGKPDAKDEVLSGPSDAADLARIVIAPFPEAGPTATARLTISPDGVSRLFRKGAEGEMTLFAPGTVLSTEDLAAGLELGIEAKDFPGPDWDGLVTLTLTVEGAATTDTVPVVDSATLRCAPLLLFANTAPTETVYVSAFGDRDSKDFIGGLRAGLTAANVPFEEIDANDERWLDRDGYGDQWTQDLFEVGWTAMPGPAGPQAMHVVLRTPNPDRPASDFTSDVLLGPDFGWLWKSSDPYDRGGDSVSLDSLGNLEAIPPYKNGVERYPFGRVYYGSVRARSMDPALRKVLAVQKVQGEPIALDTSWLFVGHVDEFVSFVPAPGPRGFVMLVASPARARAILEDLVKKDPANATLKLFDRRSWINFNTGREVPATITVAQLLADTDLLAENAKVQSLIDAERATLQTAIGLADAEIIELPVLFDAIPTDDEDDYVAYTPGIVNLLVADKALLFPRAYGPVLDGVDALAADTEAQLAALQVDATWVEDWNLYHRLDGEVHCGTNVTRKIPAKMWWEVQP